MKKYNIEVTMKYRFTVEAETPYEAYQEAQEWDEYWTDAVMDSMTISNGEEVVTY